MPQCSVQTPICSQRRSAIAGMAVSASQLGKLWTWCPVDVEEDGGEGEMVRGQEPVWRRTSQEQGGASMQASRCHAGLRVPPLVPVTLCVCLCLVWIKMDGSRQMRSHAAAGPPGISSPKIGFDRALPRSRGSEDGRQTSRDRTCEAEAEGGGRVSVWCRGPLSPRPLLHQPLTLPTHNTRTNPSTRIRSLWVRVVHSLPQSVKRGRIDKHIIKRVSSSSRP